jgi:hypothetical protein
MVSGFNTSPYDLSRMESGEANPIVIFEKVALGRFSFLIAILQYAVFIFVPTLLKVWFRLSALPIISTEYQ